MRGTPQPRIMYRLYIQDLALNTLLSEDGSLLKLHRLCSTRYKDFASYDAIRKSPGLRECDAYASYFLPADGSRAQLVSIVKLSALVP